MKSKYRNVKTEYNGKIFDSKKEADRYRILLDMQENGEIHSLECQKEFILIPAQTYQGKRYRKCSYFADFQYVDSEGNTVVEDVKGVSKGRSGTSTDTFIIKQKLLIQIYGKDIIFRIV